MNRCFLILQRIHVGLMIAALFIATATMYVIYTRRTESFAVDMSIDYSTADIAVDETPIFSDETQITSATMNIQEVPTYPSYPQTSILPPDEPLIVNGDFDDGDASQSEDLEQIPLPPNVPDATLLYTAYAAPVLAVNIVTEPGIYESDDDISW